MLLAFRVSATESMQRWLVQSRVGLSVGFISAIAFEMYLTQHLFHTNPWLRSLPFPLGAMLALIGIALLSVCVLRLSDLIRSGLKRLADGAASLTVDSRS